MDDSSGPRERRRSFWREYRFELFWLFVVLLGIFLLVERMNIRATVWAWVWAAVRVLSTGLLEIARRAGGWIAGTTLSDFIGVVFVAIATAGIVLRLRWRIMHSEWLSSSTCPVCGGPLYRIHRRPRDRVIAWFVPVKRYRCKNHDCGWSGLRVGTTSMHSRRHE